MPADIFAFCNQKGGVGKTTTVFHLAYAVAQAGRRALVVDVDPQGNASTVLTRAELASDDVGVADVLAESSNATIADAVVPTIWSGVDLVPTVPGNESLAYVRDQLVVAGAGRERRLRDAIDLVRGAYDVVLIDCPPSLDLLTVNALVAARAAVVVTQSALFAANGLARLLRTIDAVKRSYNPDLAMLGAIVNLHEIATISGREQLVSGMPFPSVLSSKTRWRPKPAWSTGGQHNPAACRPSIGTLLLCSRTDIADGSPRTYEERTRRVEPGRSAGACAPATRHRFVGRDRCATVTGQRETKAVVLPLPVHRRRSSQRSRSIVRHAGRATGPVGPRQRGDRRLPGIDSTTGCRSRNELALSHEDREYDEPITLRGNPVDSEAVRRCWATSSDSAVGPRNSGCADSWHRRGVLLAQFRCVA
jgi:chromosome partitioning protein